MYSPTPYLVIAISQIVRMTAQLRQRPKSSATLYVTFCPDADDWTVLGLSQLQIVGYFIVSWVMRVYVVGVLELGQVKDQLI